MKRKISKIKEVLIFVLLLTAANDFAGGQEAETPFRDNAIIKADFQKDLGDSDLVDKLSSPASTGSLSDDFAIESPASNEESDASAGLLGGNYDSVIDGFAQQASQLDFPKVIGALAIVLGGYFGFVWLTSKLGGGTTGGLPKEVVEVLGQTPFGPNKQLQLVRLGSKLLLLLNNRDGSTQTIGEITDPHEVDYLSSVCGNSSVNRSAIAISKASSANHGERNRSGSELKRVLQQLQQSGERNPAGNVFDA